ncbi:hypothetical protein I4J48_28730, partial [Pseudonocardia sp. KRD-169]|nr:hypothetical protein [Pseudonocardia abyssalis]
MSAAREYKAVVEGLSGAAAELRERDAERATALGYRRVVEHDAMTEAAGR